MNRNLLTILPLAIFFSFPLQSQIIERSIKWQNCIEYSIDENKFTALSFVGCFYDATTNLPYFNEKIKLNFDQTADNVTLYNIRFEDVTPEQLTVLNKSEIYPKDFELTNYLIFEKKRPYLDLSVNTIRKKANGNGYERLISFAIKYNTKTKKSQLKHTYASQSVLATGKWAKIKVTSTGMHRLTYSQLAQMGFSNMENIRIYGNAGRLLSIYNNDPTADDLQENAVFVEKGSDNIFNEGDYILFYAHGPVRWEYNATEDMYNHKIHPYAEYSYYYITDSQLPALTVQTETQPTLPSTHQTSQFDLYGYYEADNTSLIKSGQMWVGENFNILLSYDFNFNFPEIISTEQVKLKTYLLTRSSETSLYSIKVNGSQIGSIQAGTVVFNTTSTYASSNVETFTFNSSSPSMTVNISYNKPNSVSEGWLNYININARCKLKMITGQLNFRDIKTVGAGNITQFTIENTRPTTQVWDVTDSLRPLKIETTYNNSTITFTVATDSLRDFVAFDGTSYLSPVFVENVANQNLHGLHGVDMVILSPAIFRQYAEELATIHRNHDNLTVEVIDPLLIYNEFSSGMPDPAAIRNFMRMLYDRAGIDTSLLPKYLLLYGDGSYSNKYNFSGNTNFILTYQSENSVAPTASFVTDDFYGMLDENEGGNVGLLDIGIGRFPVKNATEASTMITKIRNYISSVSFKDWKNVLLFIADDEDGNMHISQADALATYVDTTYQVYNIEKIYLDAYKQTSTPNGSRYPDVNTAINNRVNKGALIVNYTGHGNEVNLAHEQVVGMSDINTWNNIHNLPLFVTATCEFSRWDDYSRTTAGETILLNSQGGGIALFTTTRLVYAQQNFALNQQFIFHVFNKNPNNEYYAFGDLMRIAKNNTGSASDINKRNFSLLGDPALKLAYPMIDVKTDSINGTDISVFTDTLKALSLMTFQGHIESNGSFLNNFDGVVYPTIYDKKRLVTTLANDGGSQYNFKLQNNIIYKGKASVTDGRFTFSFVVPKDISYVIDYGKISYYSDNITETDANGYEKLMIGGISDSNRCDEKGPEINLYLNNENFVYGSITNQSPVIIATLRDSLGINTVGNGIGHDITAIIDNNTSKSIILNDYYQADMNSYQRGRVDYQLSNLDEGLHTLTLKCWDVCNNSSEATIEFIVAESSELVVDNVLNYPNPFTTNTAFYFNHNQPNTPLDVLIQIFTVTGKIVKTIEDQMVTDSFLSSPIYWDGKDDFGDNIGKGVYIYRLKVRSPNGNMVEKIEKLVILK
ncbi:MAG: hypothetical protein CVU05_00470 [Bacteroidetes bacterium HGW-Bacteroidetes-21]|jgi:hypothetical protein|nr:MAG: hypothetical protein CVU05_00470 [Bacteroidetes bacterium HGW-Bacteroidetes-21]